MVVHIAISLIPEHPSIMEETMETYRKSAILIGALFIIGTVAGILSVVATAPFRGNPNDLSAIAASEQQLIIGALLILTMGLALALVPIVLFPIARHYNERLALGYVIFRGALEPIAYIGMVIPWLVLIIMSHSSMQAGAQSDATMQTVGTILLAVHDAFDSVLVIVFSLGALMLYTLLYQTRLLPRWLSIWGLIAIVMHLASSFLQLFGLIQPLDPIVFVIAFPIFAQEMVMAVWLIVRGFSTTAAPSRRADLQLQSA